MKSIRQQFGALAAALLLCGAANAGPVTFSATGTSFTQGAGYGDDGPGLGGPLSNEATGTLLEVTFAGSSASVSFILAGAGSFVSGPIGTVAFRELEILSAETDGLGVTAHFNVVLPVSGVLDVSATGTAVIGLTIDGGTDLTITWTGIDVPFGAGGLFHIDIDPLVFATLPDANQNVFATITLVTEPREAQVPVPATLPLLGLGLAGLGLIRRKRAR